MEAKPKIALVGRPSEVAIDSGRAKNARYTSELPSMRNSCFGEAPLDAAMHCQGYGDYDHPDVPEHPSAQYSLTIRVRIPHRPGFLGQVTTAIGAAGGTIGSIDLISHDAGYNLRDVTVDTAGIEHGERIVAAIAAIEDVEVVDTTDRTFRLHLGGKIEQVN